MEQCEEIVQDVQAFLHSLKQMDEREHYGGNQYRKLCGDRWTGGLVGEAVA